jgi:hypothetical protein
VKDQSRLALESLRRERELDAIDRLDEAIRRLRDEVAKALTSLSDETSAATKGVDAVRSEFFLFAATAESLYIRLRPELRAVVGSFGVAAGRIGNFRANAELLDILQAETTDDDPRRSDVLEMARGDLRDVQSRVHKMREDLLAAVDLYVTSPVEG